MRAPCPVGEGEPHAQRRPYGSRGRTYRYTALLCPAVLTLGDVGVQRYDQLTGAPQEGRALSATAFRGPAAPGDGSGPPPGVAGGLARPRRALHRAPRETERAHDEQDAPGTDRQTGPCSPRAPPVSVSPVQGGHGAVVRPPGSTIRLWNGATTTSHLDDAEETTLRPPLADPADPSAGRTGAAVSTRGDRLAPDGSTPARPYVRARVHGFVPAPAGQHPNGPGARGTVRALRLSVGGAILPVWTS